MKSLRFLIITLGLTLLLSSCGLWNKMFPAKYGCPTNGKNVDAGKLANDDPKAVKDAKKAKKFRS